MYSTKQYFIHQIQYGISITSTNAIPFPDSLLHTCKQGKITVKFRRWNYLHCVWALLSAIKHKKAKNVTQMFVPIVLFQIVIYSRCFPTPFQINPLPVTCMRTCLVTNVVRGLIEYYKHKLNGFVSFYAILLVGV